MKLAINKSVFVFLFLVSVGILVSVAGFFVLPDRFFFDTEIIIQDRGKEIGFIGSYPFTIWFYNITGLKYLHFSLIGFFQYLVVAFLLYRIGVPEHFHKLTLKNAIIFLSFIMVAIFLSMPTKEFITFIYMAFLILILKSTKINIQKTIFIVLALLLFFGYFFREYYFLVVVISIVFFLASNVSIRNKKIATFFYGLVTAILISLSYGVVKGEFISYKTRESFNELRINGEATNSMIVSPIDTDTWYGESFGIIYGFFSVNFPVNGLKYIASPQIIAFVFWQLLLFLILLTRYDNCIKKGIKNNYELWAFYIIFSFFIVQGVFEPDLGSAIRHKMGIFPLIYFALYYDNFRKKI